MEVFVVFRCCSIVAFFPHGAEAKAPRYTSVRTIVSALGDFGVTLRCKRVLHIWSGQYMVSFEQCWHVIPLAAGVCASTDVVLLRVNFGSSLPVKEICLAGDKS